MRNNSGSVANTLHRRYGESLVELIVSTFLASFQTQDAQTPAAPAHRPNNYRRAAQLIIMELRSWQPPGSFRWLLFAIHIQQINKLVSGNFFSAKAF